MRAHFNVMAPIGSPATDARYLLAATFYAADETQLLATLAERLPSMRKDHALVAVNADALELLLRLSAKGA